MPTLPPVGTLSGKSLAPNTPTRCVQLPPDRAVISRGAFSRVYRTVYYEGTRQPTLV